MSTGELRYEMSATEATAGDLLSATRWELLLQSQNKFEKFVHAMPIFSTRHKTEDVEKALANLCNELQTELNFIRSCIQDLKKKEEASK